VLQLHQLLLDDLNSRIWCTYRSNFAALGKQLINLQLHVVLHIALHYSSQASGSARHQAPVGLSSAVLQLIKHLKRTEVLLPLFSSTQLSDAFLPQVTVV
jgi:hypothetical protein